jgi:hypothetical protein
LHVASAIASAAFPARPGAGGVSFEAVCLWDELGGAPEDLSRLCGLVFERTVRAHRGVRRASRPGDPRGHESSTSRSAHSRCCPHSRAPR